VAALGGEKNICASVGALIKYLYEMHGATLKIKTQSRYTQRVHTQWDPYCVQFVLTLQFMYNLLADVFKMYICNKRLSVCHS